MAKLVKDFIGEYRVTDISPTRYVNAHTGVELIIRTRINPLPTQTKHYLVSQSPTEKGFTYFSGLWSTCPVGIKCKEYVISDFKTTGRKERGLCELDLFRIVIKEAA